MPYLFKMKRESMPKHLLRQAFASASIMNTVSDHQRYYIVKSIAENIHDPDLSQSGRDGRNLTKD